MESAGWMQWEGKVLHAVVGTKAPFGVVIVLCSPAELSDFFPFALESDIK